MKIEQGYIFMQGRRVRLYTVWHTETYGTSTRSAQAVHENWGIVKWVMVNESHSVYTVYRSYPMGLHIVVSTDDVYILAHI